MTFRYIQIGRNYLSGTHAIANRREHPRTLILDGQGEFADRVQREVDLPGTVKVIDDLGSVDQTEWDALILIDSYQAVNKTNAFTTTYPRVAEHLYIFKVLPKDHYGNYAVLDRVSGLNTAEGGVTLTLRWGIPGHEIAVKQGFDRELRTSLIEAAESRDTQSGLVAPTEVPTGLVLDSFAVGPQGIILAGTLKAPNRGEVWFLPSEVTTLGPWIGAAFASWRRLEPKKFPGVPDWWASPEWYSAAESAIALRIAEETAIIEEAKSKFETIRAELEAKLEKARAEAAAGSRQLLRGQDDPLQNAVRDALEGLGFGVRDMDLEWDDKERREDFRITDPDDPQWLVLGDATGVSGNAKGGKMAVLQGYVTKYVFEEKPDTIPGMWYLLNREIDKDPNVRSTILRGDEIEPFAAQKGLILDTTALYVLLRHAHSQPEDRPAIREYLRTSTGLVALPNAIAWIDMRNAAAIASE
ncbi:hypothetical protein [Pseudarthrobacter sp. WHRI 8279]|uniref:hypothetical protein n=1 Tax=Pseudarthrobacter sp. WHRI 8279 TaxID=3162566 RepID=UPI000CEBE1F7